MDFFLRIYNLLEEDLLRVVGDTKRLRKILGALSSTLLSVIPKKNETCSFDDVRPISLYNFI
jgi:hypothetical protein